MVSQDNLTPVEGMTSVGFEERVEEVARRKIKDIEELSR